MMAMYVMTFTFLMFEHCRAKYQQKKIRGNETLFLGTATTREDLINKAKGTTICHCWKVTQIISFMALALTLVFTLGFWTLIYDSTMTGVIQYWVVPVVMLLLDFAFNRMLWEVNQVWITFVYTVIFSIPSFFVVAADDKANKLN